MSGEYLTDVKEEIDELNDEIRLGHPHLFKDTKREVVDIKFIDPVEAIKKRAVEEYLERQRVALDKTKDGGTTELAAQLQGIGNSTTVNDAMSGSTSVDGTVVATTNASTAGASVIGTPSTTAAKLAALKA